MIEVLRISVVKRKGKVVRLRPNLGILLYSDERGKYGDFVDSYDSHYSGKLVGCDAMFLLCFESYIISP